MAQHDIVFLGPTMPVHAASRVLGAEFLDPAKRGDIVQAVRSGAKRIALIDGVFRDVPAVTHIEIMWALDQGVEVWGASSLGALRAAELADYGMIGVGEIFEGFRSGKLTDDDEVAIEHGPKELDYVATSEAMVNIRATVAAAQQANILVEAADVMVQSAKSRHFPYRVWTDILDDARQAGACASEIETFREWLPTGQVDAKRNDAQLLLMKMNDHRVGDIAPINARRAPMHMTETMASILADN